MRTKIILSVCAFYLLHCAPGKDMYGNAPSVQGGNKIGTVELIFEQDGKYVGWPTVLCRKSGELLVVFSGHRNGHICPYGKVQMIRSKDGGKSWSVPETLVNSPLDDRDSGIIELENGNLVLFWFNSYAYESVILKKKKGIHPEYASSLSETTDRERAEHVGNFSAVSSSNGLKWSFPVRTGGVAPHGGCLLKNGKIIQIGIGRGGEGERDKIERSGRIRVSESSDGARSWHALSVIKIPEGDNPAHYWEPHVVEASNGDLIAQIRCHKDSYLCQSVSKDGGKTWSVAKKINVVGYPSHLKKLMDGRLLTTYSRRKLPPKGDYSPSDRQMGQFARFSRDNGKTWGEEITLCRSFTEDMGYPSSAELPNGDIITVFYHKISESKKTGLYAVKWTPEKAE